jgi:hypothetical protein
MREAGQAPVQVLNSDEIGTLVELVNRGRLTEAEHGSPARSEGCIGIRHGV